MGDVMSLAGAHGDQSQLSSGLVVPALTFPSLLSLCMTHFNHVCGCLWCLSRVDNKAQSVSEISIDLGIHKYK